MSLYTALFTTPSHRLRPECLSWIDGWTPKLSWFFGTLVFIGLVLKPQLGFTQVTVPLRPASMAMAVSGLPSTASGPSWAELTPEQQQTLMPLASSWNSINEPQKRKWLGISKNYHALTPEEKTKLNSRMSEWVTLSPQQRAQARLNFGKTKELSKQLTPEEKKAKWEAYQALSSEEKQKLAAKASPKSSGAAPAVKPVAPQKLAVLPTNGNKPPLKLAHKITALPPALPVSATTATASTTPASTPER